MLGQLTCDLRSIFLSQILYLGTLPVGMTTYQRGLFLVYTSITSPNRWTCSRECISYPPFSPFALTNVWNSMQIICTAILLIWLCLAHSPVG